MQGAHDQTAGPAPPFQLAALAQSPRAATVKSKQTCSADAGFQVRTQAHWQGRVGAAYIAITGD